MTRETCTPAAAGQPITYVLAPQESEELSATVARLLAAGADPTGPGFYDDPGHSGLAPPGLLGFLKAYRRDRPACAAVVHGLPVGLVPATPVSWRTACRSGPAPADVVLALSGTALGEPFAWLTLQGGSLVQNVLPVPGEELAQSGSGSEAFLELHTEDAFHPHRPDYLLLLTMRNDDAVPTVVSSVRDVRLAGEAADLLTQQEFAIVPDPKHVCQLAKLRPGHPAIARVRQMAERPEPMAVLTRTDSGPEIRFDRPFMSSRGSDPAASTALEVLSGQLEAAQQDVAAGPGSLFIVDNRRAVHGCRPFRARYDGTDRWLKKILVRGALDLAAAGPGSSSRVLL